ncbi:MAG: MmgE/PrpD family protein, partial [Proteobacteria bacterium]|nr:MmgE/PrpD family protein [Pseudomonadota bacterium]
VGCALGGARHQAIERSWAALAPFSGFAQSALIGRRDRTDALTATFLNTFASSINVFDDTHAEAIVHPSGPVMAAVLAVSELQPVTGREALAAFTLGVEAVCRLSKAISVAPAKGDIAWSQTGLTCGIGAALAVARLLRLDSATTRTAVGIAAASASGIRAVHGSMCTAALPAFAGQSGLRAVLLARGGMTATPSVIEARYGFAHCYAAQSHLPYVTSGLGEHWEILSNTYKPYPCGIVIHPLIEAALGIAGEIGAGGAQVARVDIVANPGAMALCFRRHPKDEMEAQVSLYHWVAAALVRGRSGIAEGTDHAIAEPEIVALRDRIEVVSDAAVPHDGVDMTVRLADGRSVSRRIRDCLGSRGRPMSDEDLRRKFEAAAAGLLPKERTERLIEILLGIETLSDAGAVATACAA